jgi:hypothetical protein
MTSLTSSERAGVGATLSLGLCSLMPLTAQQQNTLPSDPPAKTSKENGTAALEFPSDPLVLRLREALANRRANLEQEANASKPQLDLTGLTADRDMSGLRAQHVSLADRVRAERQALQSQSRARAEATRAKPAFDEAFHSEVSTMVDGLMSKAEAHVESAAKKKAESAQQSKVIDAEPNEASKPSISIVSPQPEAVPAQLDFTAEPMVVTPSRNDLNQQSKIGDSLRAHQQRQMEKAVAADEANSDAADVYLCKRPAELQPITVLSALQDAGLSVVNRVVSPAVPGVDLTHHWIKTKNIEAGLGHGGGVVPGQQNSAAELRESARARGSSAIVDHRGQSERIEADCSAVPGVDPTCVEQALPIGKPQGLWIPTVNDCQTFARGIIEKCRSAFRK